MVTKESLIKALHPDLKRFLRKRRISCFAEFVTELSKQINQQDLESIPEQNAMYPLTTLLKWHNTVKGSPYWSFIAKRSIEYQTINKII